MKINQLPQFSSVDPEKITDQLQQLLDNNRQKIKALLAQPGPFSWQNLLQPLDDLEDDLHRFWSPISHLQAVMNNPALAKRLSEISLCVECVDSSAMR